MSSHFGGSHYASSHYLSNHYGRGAVFVIVPGGGMDEDLISFGKVRSREEEEFLALLIAVVSAIERDRL